MALQIVGVHYRDSTNVEKFRSVLKGVALDPGVASILLVHTPDRLPGRRGRRRFAATFRTHAPGAVFPVHADRFKNLS